MSFSLPDLPYAKDALEPHISAQTMEYHHGKHFKKYVTELNKLIAGTPYEKAKIHEIVKQSYDKQQTEIFNNAAQTFNHDMFFKCMKPNGGGEPKGDLAQQIKQDFGSFDAFKEQFNTTAQKHFGSGWAFLAWCPEKKKLAVEGHHDGSNPFVHNTYPVFCIDVWEHAFYLDYKNEKPEFVKVFMDKCANWDYAEQRFDVAKSL